MSDLVIPPVSGRRVGLFVTCLVDWARPNIGFATLELLERFGYDVLVSEQITCCGQPGYNSGDSRTARELALMWAEEFADCNYVVIPSGSCAGMIKIHYPRLFEVDNTASPADQDTGEDSQVKKIRALADKTYELSDFLIRVAKVSPTALQKIVPSFQGTITYHDSCSGLRELGIKEQPRALLNQVHGIAEVPLPGCEDCCGFGGSFAVKYGNISNALVQDKCKDIQATGAGAVVMGDLGCMMNIEGALRRAGDHETQVLHWVELCVSPPPRRTPIRTTEANRKKLIGTNDWDSL